MATMPASGNPISMSQMRTVWGLSGSLSMGAMYKGGSNVEDNILNTNIATSGNPINFGSFYDAVDVETLDCRHFWDSAPWSLSVTGVTDITDLSYNTYSSAQRIYQVRFRAGEGFCRQVVIFMESNEDHGAITDALAFYGGTTASGATNVIYSWNTVYHGEISGTRTVTIDFNADGTLDEISGNSTSGWSGKVVANTNNESTAKSASYKYYRMGTLLNSPTNKEQHSELKAMYATSGGENVRYAVPQPKD